MAWQELVAHPSWTVPCMYPHTRGAFHVLNDPSLPPLLYHSTIGTDNGTAPWWREEVLIKSLLLGMKDWLDHPAVIICAPCWFPEEAGGKHKWSLGWFFFFLTSRWDEQQQTHLQRAWLGCWQWGLRAIKDCRVLHLEWESSRALQTGQEFWEHFKVSGHALKTLSPS